MHWKVFQALEQSHSSCIIAANTSSSDKVLEILFLDLKLAQTHFMFWRTLTNKCVFLIVVSSVVFAVGCITFNTSSAACWLLSSTFATCQNKWWLSNNNFSFHTMISTISQCQNFFFRFRRRFLPFVGRKLATSKNPQQSWNLLILNCILAAFFTFSIQSLSRCVSFFAPTNSPGWNQLKHWMGTHAFLYPEKCTSCTSHRHFRSIYLL